MDVRMYSKEEVVAALDKAFSHFPDSIDRVVGLLRDQAKYLDIELPDNLGKVVHVLDFGELEEK